MAVYCSAPSPLSTPFWFAVTDTQLLGKGRSVTPASEEGLRHNLARLLAAQPPPGWDAGDAENADLDVFTQVRLLLDC